MVKIKSDNPNADNDVEKANYSLTPSGDVHVPWWLSGKESACNAEDAGDAGSIPGSGRSSGGGHGNPLQYSCLEKPVDRGAWRAAVYSVAKSQTWLNWPSALGMYDDRATRASLQCRQESDATELTKSTGDVWRHTYSRCGRFLQNEICSLPYSPGLLLSAKEYTTDLCSSLSSSRENYAK